MRGIRALYAADAYFHLYPHTTAREYGCSMSFVNFMNSTASRLVRILAGVALVVVGLAVVGGTGGIVLAVVGLVPIGAGAGNVCIAGPLFGCDLHGNPAA